MKPKTAALAAAALVAVEAVTLAIERPEDKSSSASTGYSGFESEHPFLPDNTEQLRVSALPEGQTTVLTGRTVFAAAAFAGSGSMAALPTTVAH